MDDMQTTRVDISSDMGVYSLELAQDDYFGTLLAETGRPYEEAILRLVVALTAPGDHVVDVGAHMGNHTVYWSLAGRRVTAFEPNPAVVELLRANVTHNGLESLVEIRAMAVGARRSSGQLQQPDQSNLGSVVVEPGCGPVGIIPLDETELPSFSVLKIDVEGHEADVICGARKTLLRHRPFVIAEALAGTGEVNRLLADIGYQQVPISLASTPTYLYAPSARAVVRALATQPFRQLALMRAHQIIAVRRQASSD